MGKRVIAMGIGMAVLAALMFYLQSSADEFTAEDLDRWQEP